MLDMNAEQIIERYAYVISLAVTAPREHRWWRRPKLIERDLGECFGERIVERINVADPWGPDNARWARLGPLEVARVGMVLNPIAWPHRQSYYVAPQQPRERGRPRRRLMAFMATHDISEWAFAYEIAESTIRRGLARGLDAEDIFLRAERRNARKNLHAG